MEDMSFTIDNYLKAKELGLPGAGKKASKNTLRNYRYSLEKAVELGGKPLEEFTPQDVETLLEQIAERSYSSSLSNQMLTACRMFFRWGTATGRFKGVNPFEQTVADTSEGVVLPKVLPLDKVEAMIDLFPVIARERAFRLRGDARGEIGGKYQLIAMLMYTAGLRASEAIGLRKKNIATDECALRLVGKGKRERYVPLRSDVCKRVKEAANGLEPNDYLFTRHDPGGRAFVEHTRPVSRNTFDSYFYEAAERVGLDPNEVTPHMLRHTFATHALEKTKRLEVVQDLLGHTTPMTTRIYAKVKPEALRTEYDKLWNTNGNGREEEAVDASPTESANGTEGATGDAPKTSRTRVRTARRRNPIRLVRR